MGKGKLIIIESGADGSGKATQTEIIYEKLLEEGYNVKKITFPNYKSESSALVKMYLRGDFGKKAEEVDPYIASTFFTIDRYGSFKAEWEEFYNNGGIIISDRYTTSNMIHQGAKMKGEDLEKYLEWLYELEYNFYKIPKPDYVIYLDVHPQVLFKLIENRDNKITGKKEKDIHERDKDYLIKSYNTSKYIAEKYYWDRVECVYDNNIRSIEDISKEIYSKIKKKL